jgi:ATP-binding cassette subfamily F protein 3
MKNYYLKAYRNIQKQIHHEKEMVVKLRKYKKIKQSQSRQKSLDKFEEKAKALLLDLKTTENLENASGPQLDFKPIDHLSHEVMHCENLSKSFSSQTLFDGVDLTIYGGQKLALMGPNGCGKTTFINMMLGIDQNYEGTMKFGKWVDYAYLGQEVTFEDESLSLIESLLKEGLEVAEAKKSLSKLQFYGDILNTRVADLSGGEKVRLILAMILIKAPHCLILDEPTNHLDLESRWAIEKALKDYKGTVIAVSHDRYFLNACVDKLLIVEDHKITDFDGTYDAYKNQHTQKIRHQEKIKSIKKSMNDYENRDDKTMTDGDYEHYEALGQALESMGGFI